MDIAPHPGSARLNDPAPCRSRHPKEGHMKPIVSALTFFALLFGPTAAVAAPSPQVPIDGQAIPQFVQRLPTLSVAPQSGSMTTVMGSRPLTLRMCEFRARVLPRN